MDAVFKWTDLGIPIWVILFEVAEKRFVGGYVISTMGDAHYICFPSFQIWVRTQSSKIGNFNFLNLVLEMLFAIFFFKKIKFEN